jgi:uncharacterized SAM-binding protein YcdF (DUF218 family)
VQRVGDKLSRRTEAMPYARNRREHSADYCVAHFIYPDFCHALLQCRISKWAALEYRDRVMVIDRAIIPLAETLWNYHHLNQSLVRADFIVGLGSYDLRVAERCAELYSANWAPSIIFSGYLGNWTRTLWNRSEAEIFAGHAIARGVPEDRIMLESKSTNIGENLKFTKELVRAMNIGAAAIIIVTKPSTERRAYATVKKVWPEINASVTSPQISFSEQFHGGIQEKLIHEMVGDTQRMKIYPDLGFQVSQDIPDDVWHAYGELVLRGYDKHLVK